MKKLLIITECFPPINRTASLRSGAWSRYLIHNGYFPIFVTAGENVSVADTYEKNDGYEVFRVECQSTFINELRHRFSGSLIGKVFGGIDLLFENWPFYSRLKSLEACAIENILKQKPEGMIVSAPSFSLFLYAARISKKTGLRWVADYRDDWTTNEESSSFTRFKYIVFERFLEKRSLKSASAFFAVSNNQLRKIGNLVNKPGYLLENGYDLNRVPATNSHAKLPFDIDSRKVNIVYTGTLYNTQTLSFLISVLSGLAQDAREMLSIYFVGVDKRQLLAYRELEKYYGSTVFSCGRIDKETADELLRLSDAALYIAYLDKKGNPIKGIPSSKLYEYIKIKKPVFMMPTDADEAEQTLLSVGLGIYRVTPNESRKVLEDMIKEKQFTGKVSIEVNEDAYKDASCESRANKMASYLDEIFKKGG
ncbi:MAG: hypothetical protein OQL28_01295 [Sedimenticola sp.]|nr:hypothetical protein [Sedimenticola sp.]